MYTIRPEIKKQISERANAKRTKKICIQCGKEFATIPSSPIRFCGRSCSAKWTMTNTDKKWACHTKESTVKRVKTMKLTLQNHPEIAKNASDRMKTDNPMWKPGIKEKMTQSMKGKTFLSRGGNGQITKQQRIIYDLLIQINKNWILEYPIKTKEVFDQFPSLPPYYSPDIGNPEIKVAIEIDGKTHKQQKWKFLDHRKTEVLNALGWKVLRFWNEEVDQNPELIIQRIQQFII
jgi:hypothetical protein